MLLLQSRLLLVHQVRIRRLAIVRVGIARRMSAMRSGVVIDLIGMYMIHKVLEGGGTERNFYALGPAIRQIRSPNSQQHKYLGIFLSRFS